MKQTPLERCDTVGFCATFGPNQWDPVARCKIVGPKNMGLSAEEPASPRATK